MRCCLFATFLKGSPRWKELAKSSVKRLPEVDCTLKDWQSSELTAVVDSKKKDPQSQMKKLAELLDKYWDTFYAQRLETHVYNAKNDAFLEISVPSSFSKYLVQQAWLPSTLPLRSANSKVLYRGSELFNNASGRIKSLLHTHVPYLDASLQSSKFLTHLQIRSSITKEELLQCLVSWSNAAARDSSATFRTSIDHMCNVYSYLMEDLGQSNVAIVDKFAEESPPLIFVPNRYDDIATSEDVEGRFLSIHGACWMDPASVLYSKQKYNRPLPDDLPRVLSLHYSRHQMQDTFQRIGVNDTPLMRTYVVLLKYISSLSLEPELEQVRDFTSIVTHLAGVCMEHREHVAYLTANLKGVKIFPSHRRVWVSLSNCLLDNDDPKLAKTFSKVEGVHFVQWPPKLAENRRWDNAKTQECKDEFLQMCHIRKLSNEVRTRIYHGGMTTPMDELKAQISVWVPLIQRFLSGYCQDQYTHLVDGGIVEQLSRLQVFSTQELKCLYFIEHDDHELESPDPASRICALEIDVSAIPTIYVAEKKKDKNPTYLLEPLMNLFAHGAGESEESEFQKFLSRLLSELPECAEDVNDLAQEYELSSLSDSEEEWVIPLPKKVHVEEEEESSSADESVEEGSDFEGGPAKQADVCDEDKPMTSWPPKAAIDPAPSSRKKRDTGVPNAGANVAGAAGVGIVGEEELQEVRKKHSLETEQPPRLGSGSHNATSRSDTRDGAANENLVGRQFGEKGEQQAGKWRWLCYL